MAAVVVQEVDKLGPSPMDDLVLRLLEEHRSYAIWEGKVKLKLTTC